MHEYTEHHDRCTRCGHATWTYTHPAVDQAGRTTKPERLCSPCWSEAKTEKENGK
ncbi:hypothetical protein ACOKM3_14160 [Streptomyces sp. BH106]|uniref:hypothetical protein n=1 Tax=Streptomyces sp. BH106 TaxID=3410409 RepID=UPI003CEFA242